MLHTTKQLDVCVEELPRDLRSHLYSFFDTQSIGRLSSVTKKFKLFSEDEKVWRAKLIADFKNIPVPSTEHTKEMYRDLRHSVNELNAYLKERFVSRFGGKLLKYRNKMIEEVKQGTWRPSNREELDHERKSVEKNCGMTPNDLCEQVEDFITNFVCGRGVTTKYQYPHSYLKQNPMASLLGISLALLYHKRNTGTVEWHNLNSEVLGDLSTAEQFKIRMLGEMIVDTLMFLSYRKHSLLLNHFLEITALLNIKYMNPDCSQATLSNTLVTLSLGRMNGLLSEVNEPGTPPPSPKLLSYLIDKKCSAVNVIVDPDRQIFWNPLYQACKEIFDTDYSQIPDEIATSRLNQLAECASLLIKQGNKLTDSAKDLVIGENRMWRRIHKRYIMQTSWDLLSMWRGYNYRGTYDPTDPAVAHTQIKIFESLVIEQCEMDELEALRAAQPRSHI